MMMTIIQSNTLRRLLFDQYAFKFHSRIKSLTPGFKDLIPPAFKNFIAAQHATNRGKGNMELTFCENGELQVALMAPII